MKQNELSKTVAVLDEVLQERKRQNEKHPKTPKLNGTGTFEDINSCAVARADVLRETQSNLLSWRAVLKEEVSEVFAESSEEDIRRELIHAAAVCVRWIEAIDKNKRR